MFTTPYEDLTNIEVLVITIAKTIKILFLVSPWRSNNEAVKKTKRKPKSIKKDRIAKITDIPILSANVFDFLIIKLRDKNDIRKASFSNDMTTTEMTRLLPMGFGKSRKPRGP
jgi:hypothetical protein